MLKRVGVFPLNCPPDRSMHRVHTCTGKSINSREDGNKSEVGVRIVEKGKPSTLLPSQETLFSLFSFQNYENSKQIKPDG